MPHQNISIKKLFVGYFPILSKLPNESPNVKPWWIRKMEYTVRAWVDFVQLDTQKETHDINIQWSDDLPVICYVIAIFTDCQFVDKHTSRWPFSQFVRSFVLVYALGLRAALGSEWQKSDTKSDACTKQERERYCVGGDCICSVNTRLNRFRPTGIYLTPLIRMQTHDDAHELQNIQHTQIRQPNQMTMRKTTQNVCILLDGHLLRVFIKNQQPAPFSKIYTWHLAYTVRWQTNTQWQSLAGRVRWVGNSVPHRSQYVHVV